MPGKNAEIVFEGEVSTEHIRAGLLHREHDRREILALVGVALIEHRRRAGLAQRVCERLAACGAEGVGRMNDRPFFLAERVDAVVGDHAAGIVVIRAEAE